MEASSVRAGSSLEMDKELQEIFERTYGRNKRERRSFGYTTCRRETNLTARGLRKNRKKNICWWTVKILSLHGMS